MAPNIPRLNDIILAFSEKHIYIIWLENVFG